MRSRFLSVSTCAACFLVGGTSFSASAQPAHLVLDINRKAAPSRLTISEIAAWSGTVLFSGCTEESGCEPWTSDGTPAATRMLLDLMPGPMGSYPTGFARVGEYTLFSADAGGNDLELWRTDGTAEGTVRVLVPPDRLYVSSPYRIVEAGGIHYFTSPVSVGVASLWRTDGTAEGTKIVAGGVDGALMPQGGRYVGVNSTLFFGALSGLWKTDGMRDGTVSVIQDTDAIASMVDFGGRLAFVAGGYPNRSLWISDGTTSGSRVIKSWTLEPLAVSTDEVIPLGGFLYFTACEPATGCELWRTDGTTMGTALMADISPGTASGAPRGFVAANGRLFFFAEGPTSGLFVFDPVSRSFQSLIPLNIGIPYDLDMAALDGGFLFRAIGFPPQGYGLESVLILSDGTPPGTRVVEGPDGNPVSPTSNLLERNRDVLVGLQVGDTSGLWSVDKATGALRLATGQGEITSGSDPSSFTTMGGFEFFQADEGPDSRRLWRTDGTPEKTSRIADVALGTTPIGGTSMAAAHGRLFFRGCDEDHGCELWSTDGTKAGTRLVRDLLPGPSSSYPYLIGSSGDRLLFTMLNGDPVQNLLWESDGSRDGTLRLSSDVSWAGGFAPLSDGSVLLAGNTRTSCVLAKADLRKATIAIVDENRCPGYLQGFQGRAVFIDWENPPYSYDPVLWATDGTPEGTRPILDKDGARVPAANLAVAPKRVFFLTPMNSLDMSDLWLTDGTAEGTRFVSSLPRWGPERGGSFEFEMVTAGETVFFMWNDSEHGTELWKSDGTADGTGLVKDIRPGALGSQPHALTSGGGRLYFVASDGLHGAELWTSDGTEAGTVMVQDIAPGAASSNPDELTASCAGLYFTADDGLAGREPWLLPLPAGGGDPLCHRAVSGPATGTPVRRRK